MSPPFSEADIRHMLRALSLAKRGQGRVEPNPMVGCVLVREGRVLAEGYHRRFGGPHAEIDALNRATAPCRGATCYVTLEPCCHQGKTPPCTEALIRAGIARAVAAMPDPNDLVAGEGFRALQGAGIVTEVGLLREEAERLNRPYLKYIRDQLPYVILKWAQSLDGKLATRTGDSKWITSPTARQHAHRIRARVDAILVGVGTAVADDPLLTARDVTIKRVARRVVLDSSLRISPDSRLVATARTAPTLVLTTNATLFEKESNVELLRQAGVEIAGCGEKDVDLHAVLQHLGRLGCTNLMVEGGGTVLGAFLDQRLADEAYVYVSPRIIGGRDSVCAGYGMGVESVADALGTLEYVRRLGPDYLYHLSF